MIPCRRDRSKKENSTDGREAYTQEVLRRITLPEDFFMKKGGYLLSRIALQYHRRKRA